MRVLYLYCHPLSTSGGSLATVSSLRDIVEGETTLFPHTMEEVITYAIWSDSTGDCWTWGHDTRYYESAGCLAL